MLALKSPNLRYFCTLSVEPGAVLTLGNGRLGQRRIITISGGRVTGPSLNGKILPGGADWLTVSHQGLALLDARYAVETDDGAIVEVIDQGYRHGPSETMAALASGQEIAPDTYYMRSSIRLESGAPEYAYVNSTIFIGTGAKTPSGVQIDIYAVE